MKREMKPLDRVSLEGMTCIWLLTVTRFYEDDDGEYTQEVIFTCAYGRRSKAMEAKAKARAMFPKYADIEYRVERVVFVQDELPSDEEDMAYDMLSETAKDMHALIGEAEKKMREEEGK